MTYAVDILLSAQKQLAKIDPQGRIQIISAIPRCAMIRALPGATDFPGVPAHLFRRLDGQGCRFNARTATPRTRFQQALARAHPGSG